MTKHSCRLVKHKYAILIVVVILTTKPFISGILRPTLSWWMTKQLNWTFRTNGVTSRNNRLIKQINHLQRGDGNSASVGSEKLNINRKQFDYRRRAGGRIQWVRWREGSRPELGNAIRSKTTLRGLSELLYK